MHVLGIDVGGSGIKGAPVDTAAGTLLASRRRLATPQPATPGAAAETIAAIAEHFGWKGPIGCAVPAVVLGGTVKTAAHISHTWIGFDTAGWLGGTTGGAPVTVINDADAAGYAEMHFGAGRERAGSVLVLTLGTGIGTALFINGHLVPNLELGHLEVRGREAELRASDACRRRKGLSWKKWARRLDEYLLALHRYFWPELIIIGGGVSKRADKFLPRLTVPVEVVPAVLQNDAGLIGAALAHAHAVERAGQKLSLG
jgi:polyphosphate glucokinase